MLKACLLAFLSGIVFFFLVLQSAWWLIPGVLTWTAIFIWQDRQESSRASAQASEPAAKDATEGRAGGAGRRSGGGGRYLRNEGYDRGRTGGAGEGLSRSDKGLSDQARGIDPDSSKKTGVNP